MKKRKLFVQVLVSGLLLDSAIFSTFAAESEEVTPPSGKTIKADSAPKSKAAKPAAKKVTAASTEAPGPKGDTIEARLQVLSDQKMKSNPLPKHEKVELSDDIIKSLELSNSGRFVGYGEDGGHTRRRFFGTLAISGSRQPTEHHIDNFSKKLQSTMVLAKAKVPFWLWI